MAGKQWDSVAGLRRVEQKIARAVRDSGRVEGSVTLVAVSKTQGAETIEPVLAAGHRCFGENRVQEAEGKWPGLKARWPGVTLHLIGPLQTNKVKNAVALFDVIETLDRESLVQALAKEIARSGKAPRIFVQINTGEEPQKAGVAPGEADAFIAACRETYGLTIDGLMCLPPAGELAAPHFALLAKIAARNGLTALSMGMSGDYEIAIASGATHVRVGSAIFGERSNVGAGGGVA